MGQDTSCGLLLWHPQWMQRFANSKMFMIVYGLLGTIQAMSYMYFIVTLTTLEKRFNIPSQTTGIILSGNEISQILLSLILSYAGGQRNRPRWIAWGIVFCGISCFILAVPHFAYGPGDDILKLTQEYASGNNSLTSKSTSNSSAPTKIHLCLTSPPNETCAKLVTVLPLVLVFMSQFVLGIGNTLYYSLGQTYLDDNTKMVNTPMMLAYAMSLRMLGPIGGFFLGFACLNVFIDPTKTPMITKKDPRWLGAWWLGWIILGSSMLIFSGLIGMFPKVLKKTKQQHDQSSLPRVLRNHKNDEQEMRLNQEYHSNLTLDKTIGLNLDFPQMKDFPKALMRLLKNKLLIFNIIAGIFYILGAGGYMTFLTKYIEVQFHKTAQNATIIVGPVTILGMVSGFLLSGLVISKKRPRPFALLSWNIIIGVAFLCGQILYMFIYCGDTQSLGKNGKLNLTFNCNANCSCDKVSYSPVCYEPSDVTFFSACHAGCHSWDPRKNIYSNCLCLDDQIRNHSLYDKPYEPPDYRFGLSSTSEAPAMNSEDILSAKIPSLRSGPCLKGCKKAFYLFTAISLIINWLGSSGRIGNLLVNYRAVQVRDKSFAQGLTLMLISLFALIPGPIIYGRIIDSTCLVWTSTCEGRGHCQLYDQEKFRLFMNFAAFGFTIIGVFFDILVLYYGRGLDLYGDKDTKENKNNNHTILPLLPEKDKS